MRIGEQQLAESIHGPHRRLKEIISEQRSINPSIALRLAKYFGMSPDFRMNLQLRRDLYQTQQAESEDLKAIRAHVAA
jgi:addiction module HigA family antidote